ncbi:hypothetical protein BYT27DRAFT_7240028, partial [Phlegmacium glaucopus]
MPNTTQSPAFSQICFIMENPAESAFQSSPIQSSLLLTPNGSPLFLPAHNQVSTTPVTTPSGSLAPGIPSLQETPFLLDQEEDRPDAGPDAEPDADDPNRDFMMLEATSNTIHSDTSPRSPDEANPSNLHIGQSPPLVATEPSTEAESESRVIENTANILLMSFTPDQPSINPLFPLSLPRVLSIEPDEMYWTADEDNAPDSPSFMNATGLLSDASAPNPDPLYSPTSTSPGVTWGKVFTDNFDNDLYNEDWYSSKDEWDAAVKAFSPAPLEDVAPWCYGQDGQDPENSDGDDDTGEEQMNTDSMLLPFYDRQVVKLHSFSSFPSSSISSSSPPSPVPLSHHSCFDQQVVKLQDTT